MKKLFLFLLLLSGAVQAQNKAPEIGIKIRYQQPAPKSVLRQMPTKAHSSFWGTFQLSPDKSLLGLHYFWDAKRGATTVDIFSVGKGSQPSFKRINRVELEPWDYEERTDVFGATWFWLSEKEAKIPILRLYLRDRDGFVGEIGADVFLSFAKGIRQKPGLLRLPFGNWLASDSRGGWNYVQRGEDGNARIAMRLSVNNLDAGGNGIVETLYNWDGNTFVPPKPWNEKESETPKTE